MVDDYKNKTKKFNGMDKCLLEDANGKFIISKEIIFSTI